MPETVYLTKWIKDMLTSMVFGEKEKMNLLLGDRVSHSDIFVTNATIPFSGEVNSVSLSRIPGFENLMGKVLEANLVYRQSGLKWNRFVLFSCHSHPRLVGEIVQPGDEGWSVDKVPPKYEESRGRATSVNDRDGNLLHFSLKSKSDGKGGDDIFMELVANKWRLIEYQFWSHPPIHLVGKPMTRDGAQVDCFKYDPEMMLGKIRKIRIADRLLTEDDLKKTILNPGENLYHTDPKTGKMTLPYRKRR